MSDTITDVLRGAFADVSLCGYYPACTAYGHDTYNACCGKVWCDEDLPIHRAEAGCQVDEDERGGSQ